jgi:DNA-binding response OmpR family regulator
LTTTEDRRKIYIVEDDRVISDQIAKHLRSWGLDPVKAKDFGKITDEVREISPDLILLDISLPFRNGYHWCGEIRKFSNVPVIFISSMSDNMNIVMAMNMGADDFIAKPFDLDVLAAKIQALLRRAYDFSGHGTENVLTAGDVTLDLSGAEVSRGDKKAELTKNELRILETLMRQRGTIVSRDRIMMKLWETDDFIDDNTLTVNITRLRKKLAGIGVEDLIITKKGMGYYIPSDDSGE